MMGKYLIATKKVHMLSFCTAIADVIDLSIAIKLEDPAFKDKLKWYSEDGEAFNSYKDEFLTPLYSKPPPSSFLVEPLLPPCC